MAKEVCLNCGKRFSVKIGQVTRFCSKQCRVEAQIAQERHRTPHEFHHSPSERAALRDAGRGAQIW